jgi:hypothetical protein
MKRDVQSVLARLEFERVGRHLQDYHLGSLPWGSEDDSSFPCSDD